MMSSARGTHDLRGIASVAFASLALMTLGGGGIRAATIQIDGVIADGRVMWSVGGGPATGVAVNPGDTVIWRAVSGRHGVVFDTEAAAEGVLQFETAGGLPPLGPQVVGGEAVWGTAPQNPAGPGTVLARATVKAGLAPNTRLGFFCSQHGRVMSGTLAVAGAPPSGENPPPAEKTPPVPGKQLPAGNSDTAAHVPGSRLILHLSRALGYAASSRPAADVGIDLPA
jgi:hypothetical protein